MPHDTFVRVANGIFIRELGVLLCVLQNLRSGPKAGGERHDSKHPADLSAGPSGEAAWPGGSQRPSRTWFRSARWPRNAAGAAHQRQVGRTGPWAHGHVDTALSTSQRPLLLQCSHHLGRGLLGRAPRKMDTGLRGLWLEKHILQPREPATAGGQKLLPLDTPGTYNTRCPLSTPWL